VSASGTGPGQGDRAGDAVVRVAAAVIRRGDRVLVQARPEGSHYAGHYEFPGGKLEPGEDARACCVRECAEELDLRVEVTCVLDEVRWRYPERHVHVTYLACRPRRPADEPRPREGQTLLWADAEALSRLRFLPANAGVLARLDAELRDRR